MKKYLPSASFLRRHLLKLLAAQVLFLGVLSSCSVTEPDLTKYVDQHIGTGGHGHVFMGANVPFGLVQLGPTSIPQSWDWTSGYHISDTTVIGFSHLHLSGTGIGDLSDIVFMPVTGDVTLARGREDDPASGMWSYFSRANEKARPGYYATRLDRYGVDVELTATERVGLHKYLFPKGADARVVIDLTNGQGWDSPMEGFITRVDDRTVEGYRFSRGWANDQRIFFRAEFSKPFREMRVYEDGEQRDGAEIRTKRAHAQLFFDMKPGEHLYARVALSPVSTENALMNMRGEMPELDFDAVRADATRKWNEQLGKIQISTPEASVKRNFYTAMYHTMIAPSLFCDVNGDYRGADKEIHPSGGFRNYTTLSLWDTYRAAHPLMTIIHSDMVPDVINTMLKIYEQQGKLPVWHLMGCETDCMVGNPAVPVVADAILKGYGGFDHELAYEAMKNSMLLDERGLGLLKEYGYIPCDMYNESVATALEYALADWSVAQVAAKLGKTQDHEYFMERSRSYVHYFDPETRFMRGKTSDGRFREPFNPFRSAHRVDDYTEGNAWQYTWLVPHDVEGLVKLFGGIDKFTAKLDSLFIVSGDLGDNASPDISGLIGQYAHGNEPSHHVLYLYAMTGQPWKAAPHIREVLTTLYRDQPDGLSGNEDVGQMSSWYILSAMGLYQAEPAGGRYWFGSPLIDRATIKLRGGREFRIRARDNGPENIYIQEVRLNGRVYRENYISFEDIAAGGALEFRMGPEPASWNEKNDSAN